VQETVLVTLYVYYFLQYTTDSREERATKATLRLLVGAECAVLSTDIVLNVLLYKRLYLPRAMIQPFSSMLKLKIEFIVLNSLIKYAHCKASRAAPPSWTSGAETMASPSGPVVISAGTRVPELPIHDGIEARRGRTKLFFSLSLRESHRRPPVSSLEVV
jgi:hypothetical protein